jgi:hypothetical protein
MPIGCQYNVVTDMPCQRSTVERGRWSDQLLNPFALSREDQVVHASDADRDQDGPFRCVECNRTLLLKAGPVRRRHFAHEASDFAVKCRPLWASLRRYAVEMITRELRLRLPPRYIGEDPRKREWSPSVDATFDGATVPPARSEGDLVLTKGKRRLRLFFRSKRSKVSAEPQPEESALIIDMRNAPIQDRNQLGEHIRSAGAREWLWHRRDKHWRAEIEKDRQSIERGHREGLAALGRARSESLDAQARTASTLIAEENDIAAARLRRVGSLMVKHRPRIDLLDFLDAAQPFLNGQSPRAYNTYKSDIEVLVEQWLGLRDACFRPIANGER